MAHSHPLMCNNYLHNGVTPPPRYTNKRGLIPWAQEFKTARGLSRAWAFHDSTQARHAPPNKASRHVRTATSTYLNITHNTN